MIRHIVLIRVKTDISEAAILGIFDELEIVRKDVPGMGAIISGRSQSPEKIERGYMHGFTIDFENWQDLALYQSNPVHKATGAKIVNISIGGLDGVLVFDVET